MFFYLFSNQKTLHYLQIMNIGKSKADIKLEKCGRVKTMLIWGLEIAMGGVWGFKALSLSAAEFLPQGMLSAKESSRGGEKRREVVLKKGLS